MLEVELDISKDGRAYLRKVLAAVGKTMDLQEKISISKWDSTQGRSRDWWFIQNGAMRHHLCD